MEFLLLEGKWLIKVVVGVTVLLRRGSVTVERVQIMFVGGNRFVGVLFEVSW